VANQDACLVGYFEALAAFNRLLADEAVQRAWSRPPLVKGGYTVGGVAVHVSTANATIKTWMDKPPADDITVVSAAEYYVGTCLMPARGPDFASGPPKLVALAAATAPLHGQLVTMANETAAKRGHSGVSASLVSTEEFLRDRLPDIGLDQVLDLRPFLPVGITLRDTLINRTTELIIHGDDVAVGSEIALPQPQPTSLSIAFSTLLDTSRTMHGDLAVLRALTRRERAPADVFPVF
jgi:hypothetical protein